MLKGSKINIRPLRRSDLPRYLELYNDIESRGPFFPLVVLTEPTLEKRFDKDGYWSDETMLAVIVDKETDRLIGVISAFKPVIFYDAYELGYIVFDPKDRGKGYTADAIQVFCRFLFTLKPICRLQIQPEAANIGSVRAAEKCGFTFEGPVRAAFLREGEPVDLAMYSLTRTEWNSRASKTD